MTQPNNAANRETPCRACGHTDPHDVPPIQLCRSCPCDGSPENLAQASGVDATDGLTSQRAYNPEAALRREIEARQHPPHLDGSYREGIYEGLRLALRIVAGTPDEHPDEDFPDDPTSVNVHRYPACRVASDA